MVKEIYRRCVIGISVRFESILKGKEVKELKRREMKKDGKIGMNYLKEEGRNRNGIGG